VQKVVTLSQLSGYFVDFITDKIILMALKIFESGQKLEADKA
jgi:uncharacterized membrane protein YoaK (UPF0700 family)